MFLYEYICTYMCINIDIRTQLCRAYIAKETVKKWKVDTWKTNYTEKTKSRV